MGGRLGLIVSGFTPDSVTSAYTTFVRGLRPVWVGGIKSGNLTFLLAYKVLGPNLLVADVRPHYLYFAFHLGVLCCWWLPAGILSSSESFTELLPSTVS